MSADDQADGARADTPHTITAAIDRIEGRTVVLVDDRGAAYAVPLRRLPKGSRWIEGLVVHAPLDRAGRPDWSAATADTAETERRYAEAAARLARLRKRDPGGDVRL